MSLFSPYVAKRRDLNFILVNEIGLPFLSDSSGVHMLVRPPFPQAFDNNSIKELDRLLKKFSGNFEEIMRNEPQKLLEAKPMTQQ